jgi:hypothetical protein
VEGLTDSKPHQEFYSFYPSRPQREILSLAFKKFKAPRHKEKLVFPALDLGNSIEDFEHRPCFPSVKYPNIIGFLVSQESRIQKKELLRRELGMPLTFEQLRPNDGHTY